MTFRDYTKYEVYEDGRIWSYITKKFLKPSTNNAGYQVVSLSDNEGKKKTYLLHRVIYETFSGRPIPEGYEINHISEAKEENFFANLQLLTHKQNINFGTRNSRDAKLKSKQVGAFKNGEIILTFPSLSEAQRQGFKKGNVWACCNGKWTHYKGYEWKYI